MNSKYIIYNDDEREFLCQELIPGCGRYTRNVYNAKTFETKEDAEQWASKNELFSSLTFLKIID